MNSNKEIAKIVIGKILHKPEYYFTNYQILHHKLFLDYVDENLFKRIKKKLDQSLPVDEAVLISDIDDPNLITRVTEYGESAYTKVDFVNCIKILDEDSKKHQLKLLGSDLVSLSNNGKPVIEILEEIQNKLSKINLENKMPISEKQFELKDALIRQTILNNGQQLETQQQQLNKIEDKIDKIDTRLYNLNN